PQLSTVVRPDRGYWIALALIIFLNKTIINGAGSLIGRSTFPSAPHHSTNYMRRVTMKRFVTAAFVVAMLALLVSPGKLLAQGSDTLVVYASGHTLDQVILGDTAGTGAKLHHVYQLVSLDTTYLFDATITTSENLTIVGMPNPG